MRSIARALCLLVICVGASGWAARTSPRIARVQPRSGRVHIALAAHAVQDVIAPKAAMLLRSWQKQAEDEWAQGFTPASTMDQMRRLSAQVKQLQRMAALARVIMMSSGPTGVGNQESHFAPYLSRLPHTSIVAAVAPGNGTAIAISATMADSVEVLHIESSPVCNEEQGRNAQAALFDAFLARASDSLSPTGVVSADAAPGSETEELLIERGFVQVSGVEGWMPGFVRYARPVQLTGS
jgi:hypothetical protein